jgi:hypothetical protein
MGSVIRAIPRRLLTALVVPLVVIVGLQSAWAAYVCRLDGKVRDHCCCAAEREHPRPTDDATHIAARGCCDVTVHATREAPAARAATAATFVHVPLVLPVVAFVRPAPRPARVVTIAHPPRPPPRVPLFLDKQALLR